MQQPAQQTVSCVLVDDDEIDLLTVAAFLEDYPFLQVRGRYRTAASALYAMSEALPEVIFLDIDMPGMSGLELRSRFLQIPVCIFITAFPDYALEGFELSAFDFMVKPFTHDRFAKTMNRLQEYFLVRQKAALLDHALGADTIFIKEGHDQVKLRLHDIIYLEALNSYTAIVTTAQRHMVLSTLGKLLEEKAFAGFVRIHRSYAVQKHYIKKITAAAVLVDSIQLPVGRAYKHVLTSL